MHAFAFFGLRNAFIYLYRYVSSCLHKQRVENNSELRNVAAPGRQRAEEQRAEVVASRSLKGHAQLLLDWLKNAVVGMNRALWKEPRDRQLSHQA